MALLFVAVACTTSSPSPSTTTTTEPAAPATTAAPTTSAPVAPEVDRLLVLGEDGNVYTVSRNGSDRIEITTDGGPDHVYFQPTWSPDASLVAFSERADDGAYIVTKTDAGVDDSRTGTASPAFYMYWSPVGDRLAYLSNGSQGSLELAVLVPGSGVEVIDTGAPFYFAWGPDGSELLIHVGTDRLDHLAIDGTAIPTGETPGAFQAPHWSSDGSRQAYAVRTGDTETILVVEDGEATTVASYVGSGVFVMSADGRRLAYRTFDGDGDVTAAGPGILAAQAGGAVVTVFDLDTEERSVVAVPNTVAFWWSPDGDKLLLLGIGDRAGSLVELDPYVWEAGELTDYRGFIPSPTFARDYLPFFDQYASSMTLWSPDSNAFTYPGLARDGRAGIWVQPLGEDTPELVGDGSFVAWSPR